MDKSIIRRLDVLQRLADRNKPCKVIVTFTNGSRATTDPAGALDFLQERGPGGEVDGFQTDSPLYARWAQLMTILLHPMENRRIEDFET